VLTGFVFDPFGGIKDIEEKVIRHVSSKTFVEDPLRVFRACQFAARFGFYIAPQTRGLCSGMDLKSLPKERVFEELKKKLY
jgi:tRNA nucleotidyltransferase/poly(A) polymerase